MIALIGASGRSGAALARALHASGQRGFGQHGGNFAVLHQHGMAGMEVVIAQDAGVGQCEVAHFRVPLLQIIISTCAPCCLQKPGAAAARLLPFARSARGRRGGGALACIDVSSNPSPTLPCMQGREQEPCPIARRVARPV